jgi:hypothetical protein
MHLRKRMMHLATLYFLVFNCGFALAGLPFHESLACMWNVGHQSVALALALVLARVADAPHTP